VSEAPSPRVPTAVLISGRGSNMVALLAAAEDPAYPADIRLVVSNVPGAPGLIAASHSGAIVATVDHKVFGKDRERFERALDAVLRAYGIRLVCLAGFMRVLTPWFVSRWSGRLLNVHPSLLPAFPGLDTHARALEAGVAEHGCTVHQVVAEVDAGEILAQARVPVLPGDTADTLAARVLAEEHRIYPRALARVAAALRD
jgi:phosphoribosylglycinamide formyltransferase 1